MEKCTTTAMTINQGIHCNIAKDTDATTQHLGRNQIVIINMKNLNQAANHFNRTKESLNFS